MSSNDTPSQHQIEDEDGLFGEIFTDDAGEEEPFLDQAVIPYETILSHSPLKIRLARKHPLWGHVLYPSAKLLAGLIESNAQGLVDDKYVLELGAGAALPGIIAALAGSQKVVITDFGDLDLLSNITGNVSTNLGPSIQSKVAVKGFTWGTNARPLLDELSEEKSTGKYFDLILMSDLVFNHSQHLALIKSLEDCFGSRPHLNESDGSKQLFNFDGPVASLAKFSHPLALVFFQHHRPKPDLVQKDRAFLQLALDRGWKVHRVTRDETPGPAFPEDLGDVTIRSTVHGFAMFPPDSVIEEK